MGKRRLYLGLWLRMAVALLLGAGGLVVLFAAEFALAAVVSFWVLVLGPLIGGMAFLLAGLGAVFVCFLWVLSLTVGDAELSDLRGRGDSEAETESERWFPFLEDPPAVRDVAGGLGRIVGVGVGPILVYGIAFNVYDADPIPLALGTGALVVVGFNLWLVYDELRSTGSVRDELEAEYDIISDPELEHELQHRVRRLARQADTGVPAVGVGASYLPQAASVGYNPEESVILVSRGLVERLDGDELDAVLAHELAHLINRDAAVMTALSVPQSKIRELVDLFRYHPSYSDAELLLIPLLLVCAPVYIVNRLVVPMVARYREYVADDAAGELTGSHAAMASALVTLDREHSTRNTQDLRSRWSTAAFGVVAPPWTERKVLDGQIRFVYRRVLGTHPPTESRIERLRTWTD